MSNQSKSHPEKRSPDVGRVEKPRCVDIADGGLTTASRFSEFMSAVMADVVSGRITPQVANAAANAGGKMLKVVEMQQRYGQVGTATKRELKLIGE